MVGRLDAWGYRLGWCVGLKVVRFGGDGLGDERLAGAGRAEEQQALGRTARAREDVGPHERPHCDLAHRLLGEGQPSDGVEGHPGRGVEHVVEDHLRQLHVHAAHRRVSSQVLQLGGLPLRTAVAATRAAAAATSGQLFVSLAGSRPEQLPFLFFWLLPCVLSSGTTRARNGVLAASHCCCCRQVDLLRVAGKL